MAEYNCKDINGNDIKQFVFGDDGVVYGVSGYENLETNYETTVPYEEDSNLTHLSLECCGHIGQTYNSDNGKCYHRVEEDVDVKIVFNVDNHNGLVFSKNEGEKCSIDLKFDMLIEYDSDILYPLVENNTTLVSDILKGLNLSVLIEKQVNITSSENIVYEGNKTLVPIIEKNIYQIDSFNQNTGVIVSGSKVNFISNKLQEELGFGYTPTILNGDWMRVNVTIDNQDVLDDIVNEEIKFSILVNENPVEFSVIMDNIELVRTSEIEYVERKTIDKSPSFEMVRVIDNKKSWTDDNKERIFDLELRETDYDIDNDKMVLNSKEIELSTSISDTIERDMVDFISSNIDLITGIEESPEKHESLNMLSISEDISKTKSTQELLDVLSKTLVDVKTRKTSIGYPVLELLYERYLNSERYTTNESNKFTYGHLNKFIGLLGNHWVGLIEQMVPSTTIWSSSHKIGASRFRPNKFNYKRCNLRFNHKNNDYYIVKEDNVEVVVSEITTQNPTTDIYGNIYIKGFSNGGISIGNVSVLNSSGNNNNTINEN